MPDDVRGLDSVLRAQSFHQIDERSPLRRRRFLCVEIPHQTNADTKFVVLRRMRVRARLLPVPARPRRDLPIALPLAVADYKMIPQTLPPANFAMVRVKTLRAPARPSGVMHDNISPAPRRSLRVRCGRFLFKLRQFRSCRRRKKVAQRKLAPSILVRKKPHRRDDNCGKKQHPQGNCKGLAKTLWNFFPGDFRPATPGFERMSKRFAPPRFDRRPSRVRECFKGVRIGVKEVR